MSAPAIATPGRLRAGLDDHPWVSFALRRTGRLVVSLWVLVTASFLMLHAIPGDAVRAALGPTAPASLIAEQRTAMGLDDPLPLQYVRYLGHVLTGDLGSSLVTRLPVTDVISQRLPATLELAVLAFAVALLIAVPLGVGMALLTRGGRGRRLEVGFTTTSVVIGTIPDFLLGVVFVYVFAVTLNWLPVANRAGASSYVLPVLALAIGPGVVLARILRVEMLAVLQADFVRTARAKRLPAPVVYLGHALPNALTATLTLSGLLLSSLVAGTVLVENVFAWNGLGSTIVSSIQNKDYSLVQGTVLVYGVGVLLVNLVVDVLLAVSDPRSMVRES